MSDEIIIRGARTHNLKNIDCAIPNGKLTVVSGVSGSGKSSLAFDTIYAEGQRRYVESLSAYARQFLERIEKPDVDLIDGLAPAIAIKQKNSTRNPRSTVATATEIYDYMRLLWARCGQVHCIVCGGIVRRDTVDEIAAAILALGDGTRLHAIFPVHAHAAPAATPAGSDAEKPAKPARKTKKATAAAETAKASTAISDALRDRLADLRRRGFNRLYQNGNIYEFSTPESLLEIDFSQPVFVLVDRIAVSAENRARIVDAAEIGYRESGEILYEVVAARADGDAPQEPKRLRFSAAFECKTCHRQYREPEPSLFSFNNPYGACPRCQGFGNTIDFDLDLIIPDKAKTLDEGAIDPWNRPKYRTYLTDLRKAARQNGIPLDVAWWDLTPEQQSFVLDGRGSFLGVHGFFQYLERKKYKLHVRVMLSKYRGYALCPDCKGQRLRAEARAVRIGGDGVPGTGKNICDAAALTIATARHFFSSLTLTPMQEEIAGSILHEIRQRLKFLDAVGLDYLTLDRLASTLSGGESQRIQLATSLGSRLVGALYVLDEPSIGLHPRDTARLIHILDDLRDLGNTILVVEHDPDVLRAADYLLDLGPGAGEFGGKVLAAGPVDEVAHNPASITGKYLSGQLTIPVPSRRNPPGSAKEWLRLRGARAHNLRGLDVDIPLNLLVAITGVSGSGKSTLVHEVLYKAVAHRLGRTEGGDPSAVYKDLKGVERLNDIVLVDQTPIGRTPRSNPVTYIKAFDAIRELFAAQSEAQRRGYAAGHFSFNVPGGRCDVCEGDGTVTVEMQFLADVELPCEECSGSRYKASTLEIHYKNKNIHDVLQMTVREALRFFAGHPKIVDKLAVLEEIGLGYVRLGQSATTLSGGEAQRVKLAAHLAATRSESRSASNGDGKRGGGSRILYILDEPTTGLHFDDVGKLLVAFRKLIDSGGSLLVIEHNLDVIKSADWVIDLGPEGGSAGGQVVATGTPEEIMRDRRSHTGEWLKHVLNGHVPASIESPTESEVLS
ncbi:MAG TPA: excinuclease ABC subunit UvrA [Acidobacteriaceae bacterium]|nr:excinuclease ABC subunit UvrA [Acidobacteriaceae bacterium]